MKTKTKRIFSVLLALAMVLTALPLTAFPAAAATSGDFEYEVLFEEDKTCEITGYTSSVTELAIPSELDGYTVTSIGYYAFYKCSALTSITIPDSVTSIGSSAFSNCTALTSITIPDSVTSIGSNAFYGTAYYNDASNWANDVLYIGNHLIKAKTTLSGAYTVKSGTKTIVRSAFYKCTALTSITISDSVTSIGEDAFYGCTSLTSVTIPDSVTSIGGCAFYGCTALISITIPDSVTSIGSSAFSNCTALTSIALPDSMTYIGNSAFSNTAYYNDASNWENDVLYIGDHLIEAKTTIVGEYTVKTGTKTIADYAFDNCTSLTSITIPNSVTSIGGQAFESCTALTNITIPNSVMSIGSSAFENCKSLTSVTLGNGVTSIGAYAFYNCASLTNITIPSSVMSIGYGAFSNCTALTSITIPSSVTEIGYGAFYGCSTLAEIYVDAGNPNYASENGVLFDKEKTELICYPAGKQDRSYAIPNSITYIGPYAFSSCTSLTSIAIPNSVTSIGNYAFADSSLTTIYGYADSYAETFASENGYTFVALLKLTDTETGVSVGEDSFGNFAENTALNVEQLSATSNAVTYDITLTVSGEVAQPANAVTVKIPVSEAMAGAQCKVYRQEPDGTYTDMHAIYQNGYMVFTTDHFSTYILTTQRLGITLGDVNGDGKINAVDARWILQAASGARTLDATQAAAADVNGDGKINAVDARWILQAASGARTL
ncbi:MAG: leucine-rich repeat protein [Candidatus Fimenecus sp.]